ncbi:nitrate- and nitrite sensing domain-containing protein [Streptomyces thermolineatus]|uniref:sensor histidine kinase n=1 Tax=Streptomyces thermolineatus TaxID=44033 RepID=UPI00384EB601
MALLMVPLVSLIGIWGFASVVTGRDVVGLLGVERITQGIGYPLDEVVETLQHERREALVYLADPRRSTAQADLERSQDATDEAVEAFREVAAEENLRSALRQSSLTRMDTVVDRLGDIGELRTGISETKTTRIEAYRSYTRLIDAAHDFFGTVNPLNNGDLDRQARVLTELARAREGIAREDALYAAAAASGRTSTAEMRAFSDSVAEQRMLFGNSPGTVSEAARRSYSDYWHGGTGRKLRAAEERIVAAGVSGAPTAVGAQEWGGLTATALDDLAVLHRRTVEDFQGNVEPFARSVLLKAGIAGGLGLIAVVASVVVSFRIGREIAHDLSELRKEALEASGTRLPRVMRRLAAGEDVDVAAEVPEHEYGDDEIGQVGQALGTLQTAAVEAAVKQARMRRGVSEVFVNLARRSQALVHRQLTLLDTMERRTEDAAELADLFRLDHMATRMRRHAEGLVILSGAAPSRQWRKPVQLIDVVRAAIAAVEDYERVEVRRLPRLAVNGPAVADLTHLIAELIENATVFSPPQTTVQVHGEAVANGFVLEIDDRGLGMTPDGLLEANLRLAETPEFELSDTDRLGLFVVSRLARRQNVRVSLRPSPYGGTSAVVLIPSGLLSEDAESSRTGEQRAPKASAPAPVGLAAVPAAGDERPEGSEDRSGGDSASSSGPGLRALLDAERERGRSRGRSAAPAARQDERPGRGDTDSAHSQAFRQWGIPDGPAAGDEPRDHPVGDRGDRSADDRPAGPPQAGDRTGTGLPRRRTPRLVTGDGAPGGPPALPRRRRQATLAGGAVGSTDPEGANPPPAEEREAAPEPSGVPSGTPAPAPAAVAAPEAAPAPAPEAAARPRPAGPGGLPRRVKQASLAPQLRASAATRGGAGGRADSSRESAARERSADEVRARMASLQRGWQRGRTEADTEDSGAQGPSQGPGTTAPRMTREGDGR